MAVRKQPYWTMHPRNSVVVYKLRALNTCHNNGLQGARIQALSPRAQVLTLFGTGYTADLPKTAVSRSTTEPKMWGSPNLGHGNNRTVILLKIS